MSDCQVLQFTEVDGVCDYCGDPLTGRQKRWCSMTCSETFRAHHDWNSARRAAIKRDGAKCRTCGSHGSIATSGPWKGYTRPLEVNHIVPRVGAGYGWGCWNHPENLETLCHDCHVKVTNQQAAARRAAA